MPDWLGQSKVKNDGTAEVDLEQNNTSVVWVIEQVSASVGPKSTGGNIAIFKNGNLVAPTTALAPQISPIGIPAVGQTASGLPYVYVQTSDVLQIVVTSVTVGDLLTVRAQYQELPLNDPTVRGR